MNRTGWRSRIVDALVLVLAVGVVAHLVSAWLQPLVPALIAFILAGAAIGWLFKRY
jgi:hypothetical protein